MELTKLDILKFMEREINRLGFDENVSDIMKLEVAQMIKKGEVTENTSADHKLFEKLHKGAMQELK